MHDPVDLWAHRKDLIHMSTRACAVHGLWVGQRALRNGQIGRTILASFGLHPSHSESPLPHVIFVGVPKKLHESAPVVHHLYGVHANTTCPCAHAESCKQHGPLRPPPLHPLSETLEGSVAATASVDTLYDRDAVQGHTTIGARSSVHHFPPLWSGRCSTKSNTTSRPDGPCKWGC